MFTLIGIWIICGLVAVLLTRRMYKTSTYPFNQMDVYVLIIFGLFTLILSIIGYVRFKLRYK